MQALKQVGDFYEGTSTEFVNAGVQVNGQKIDAVGVSVLAKYGIIEVVGKAEKIEGKRGKVGNIFRIKKSFVSF